MTEKRIVVPEGMLKAVWDVDGDGLGYIEEHRTLDHLEAARRFLLDLVQDVDQIADVRAAFVELGYGDAVMHGEDRFGSGKRTGV